MTATYPAPTGLRPCRLYRFYVTHPATGDVVLGYVGETGRQPFERLLEHLATQPWFDTVVRWELDPQVFAGKEAVLRAETAAIRTERPLYNVKGNEANRKRIIPPDAIRQRRARDAAASNERWVHPDDRGLRQHPGRAIPVRQNRSALTRGQKFAIGWGCTWVVTTLAGWIEAVHAHLGGWKQTGVGATLILPGMLLILALVLSQSSRRRRRKVWRFLTGRRR